MDFVILLRPAARTACKEIRKEGNRYTQGSAPNVRSCGGRETIASQAEGGTDKGDSEGQGALTPAVDNVVVKPLRSVKAVKAHTFTAEEISDDQHHGEQNCDGHKQADIHGDVTGVPKMACFDWNGGREGR